MAMWTQGWKSLRHCHRTHLFHVLRLPNQTAFVHVKAVVPRSVVIRAQQPSSKNASKNSPGSFSELNLMPELVDAVTSFGVSKPTEIQALAVPRLQQQGEYMLASHTGSGKTLAYLLPLVDCIKQEEKAAGAAGRPKRPRVLVLGPTKELTEQITGVAKSLCHFAKFRVVCVNSNGTWKVQREALAGPVDMVVATPTRLLQHLKEGHVALSDVAWLVLDEADTMLDQGFGPEVRAIIEPCKKKGSKPCGVVMVSATMTNAVRRLMKEQFPAIQTLETSSLHKAVAGSRHVFSSLPPGRDKLDVLREVLQVEQRKGSKLLVFCNTMDSCRAVDHYCRESGMATVCYHGDMPIQQRKEAMASFAGTTAPSDSQGSIPSPSPSSSGSGTGSPTSTSPSGSPNIMVATDLAARGLDFPGRVDHVINFDFPVSPVDYLHRTGRTARAGNTGTITSLVGGKDRVLAQRIEWALKHDEPLDGLSRDPNVKPPSQRRKPSSESKSKLALAARRLSPKERLDLARKGRKITSKGLRGAARVEVQEAQRKSKLLGPAGAKRAAAAGPPPSAGGKAKRFGKGGR